MRSPRWLPAAALLLCACSAPPRPLEVSIFGGDGEAKIEGIELDGKPLPSSSKDHWSVTIAPGDHVTTMASRFTLIERTTCGTERVPFKAIEVGIRHSSDPSGEDYERKDLKPGEPLLASAVIDPPKTARLVPDWEGVKPGTVVTVGSMAVPAGVDHVYLPVGLCEGAADVKVGGKAVGSVAAVAKDAAVPVSLLDVVGGHCYELVTHTYATDDMANSVGGRMFEPKPPEKLAGKRVYVRTVDYVFQPAPTELTTEDDASTSDRTELRRCAAAKATKPTKGKKHR